MRRKSHLRILHCPDNIGGQPGNLARNERELGLDSISVSYGASHYGYAIDHLIWDNDTPVWIQELKRWRLLVKSLFSYNVIHYNCGKSILNWGSLRDESSGLFSGLKELYGKINMYVEPTLMRLGRKRIFVTYQGSDARQVAFCKENFDINIFGGWELDAGIIFTDAAKQKRIAVFETFASGIFATNPDILHVLPGHSEFLPYAHIDLNDWQFLGIRADKSDPIRIVHAPTNRDVKGTQHLHRAIKKLRETGFDFEYQLIEGLSQKDARTHYEEADIIVDQLLAGWYGGLAVEAMALGKVVVGYIRNEDLVFIPQDMRKQIPIENATPETIFHVLEKLLQQSRCQLKEKGIKGRQYVERWHNPTEIAKYLKSNYEGKVNN